MTDTACTLERRDEFLVAYLYDDLQPDERQAFTAHLGRAACAAPNWTICATCGATSRNGRRRLPRAY